MNYPSLTQLGLRPFFQQQMTLDDYEQSQLGRVVEHHRSEVVVWSDQGVFKFPLTPKLQRICVGDWILFDSNKIVSVLERQSLFQRKAVNSEHDTQLIAANIDSVFIVCSLNQDFSLNRIERYLAVAREAQAEPVVVLTKADQCNEVDALKEAVQRLDPLLAVYAVNALDTHAVEALKVYCRTGQTVALLGSSGVGKSTLVNNLLGLESMVTGEIRESDSKGRHTTTYRAIKWLPEGGLLMDTPGMREIQLSGCDEGLKQTFADIEALINHCRFADCTHQNEPGCAVIKALNKGKLDERRLNNYFKLKREEAHNSASVAERRSKDRSFSKMINTVQNQSRSMKKFR